MIALYRPGSGFLHRLSAGVKLALLVAATVVAVAVSQSALVAWVAMGVALLLYPLARVSFAACAVPLWQLKWLLLLLTVLLWVFDSAEAAAVAVLRITTVLVLASLYTATTRMGDTMEVIQAVVRPLERWGVSPDAVALTISLTLTVVPVVAGFHAATREAQQARGVRLRIRAVIPLLVMAMRYADDVGDALVARGVLVSTGERYS
ncbi:energy-coupling factor transporter transmembrane component T family protein [Microbacterium sp. YY-01]|uniref:energy-coupling factor transporter transmembrane component T family protein n=1 Tax=Microbacterium sp. YY-01 TaxID=3421634 RepID=UPI003D165732